MHVMDVLAGVENALLTILLTSDANMSMPAFEPQEDILHNHCDTN